MSGGLTNAEDTDLGVTLDTNLRKDMMSNLSSFVDDPLP